MTGVDEELLDFFAQGLRIFGPTARIRMEVGGYIGKLAMAADPKWRPPTKTFRQTAPGMAHSVPQRKSRNGEKKGGEKRTGKAETSQGSQGKNADRSLFNR